MPKHIKVLAWLPAVLWYSVIWRFSAQPATVSGDLSDRLLWRILNALSPAFAPAPQHVQTAAVELLSFFERKTAHMFLYFVLALLVLFALRFLCKHRGVRMGLALLVCAVLAALDEYHQTMVPGRSGEVRDVLVDLAGAGIALGLTALPLLAAWCRQNMGFPIPALVPALLCLLPLLPALLSPEILAGLSPIVWAAEQFFPEAEILPSASWPKMLADLAAVVRDTFFLASCGLLGVCTLLAAGLASLRGRGIALCALGAVLLAAVLAWATGAALPSAAAGLTVLGILLAGLLWAAAQGMDMTARSQRAKPLIHTNGKKYR